MSTSENDDKVSLTPGGLPLGSSSSPPANLSDKTRRTDCPTPSLPAAPPRRPSKRAIRGSLHRSLIDDSDDELVDYFSARDSAAGASPGERLTPEQAQTDLAPHASSRWGVGEDLRALPSSSFYPLEKSSVFVPASAKITATRIENVFRERSIAASYDASNAKADCVSVSGVLFRLRMYRGNGEKGEDGVIVEVQRREGFNPGYIQDVHAILDAAMGVPQNPQANTLDWLKK